MKRIDLKVAWSSYNGANIYQNVCTFWKCFELGVKKEKLTNEFLKTYINEINKNFSYTHYNIGIKIDFIISELSFLLDDFFERVKKKIQGQFYWNTFPSYLESLDVVFPFIKENILWIYKQTVFLKNYWAYHTPKMIHWRSNNRDVAKSIKGEFPKYMDAIQAENQEYRIFSNYGVNFSDNIAPIFPWELIFDRKSKGAIPIKYINDETEKKLDKLVDSVYEYFIKNDIREFLNIVQKNVGEQSSGKMGNFFNQTSQEEMAKSVFMKHFLSYRDQLMWFVLDTYFKKSCIYGIDYYLYENQYFLDLTDVVMIGWLVEKTKGEYMLKNRFSLEMMQQLLIDGLKDGYYDHYVMKLTYYFDDENGESYKITPRGEGIYEFYDGKKIELIELDDDEQKLLNMLESTGRKKVRWWITLGLYSQKLSAIKDFKLLMAKHMKTVGYKIFFRKGGGDNIFEHNNYLFQQNPIKTCTNLTPAFNIKRFFEIMPDISENSEDGIYLGIDWYSKQPLIKQPFADGIDNAKHMAIMGSSGSGKTLFTQQLICSNVRDKFFIIDPTGTFAMLRNLTESVTVKRLYELDYNPITLDKKLYTQFGVDWKEGRNSKIDILMMLLKPKSIWASEDFITTLRIFFAWLYEEYEVVTIELIKEQIEKIILEKAYPEWVQIGVGVNRDVDPRSLALFGALIRKILSLKTEGAIYDFLNKRQDFLKLFLDNTKLVIDISELNIVQKKNLDERSEIIMMYLLQNILSYCAFHASFVKINKAKIPVMPRNYIIFDEIHFMFNNKAFRELYLVVLRTLRNLWSQITGLTQFVSDFAFSTEEWGSELDVLNQNFIKFFFKDEDILSYISLLNKAFGIKAKEWEEAEMQDDEPIILKQLKFYYSEFQKLYKEHAVEGASWKDKFRLMLVEWYGNYYLTIPQISEVFLNNMHLLSTSETEKK